MASRSRVSQALNARCRVSRIFRMRSHDRLDVCSLRSSNLNIGPRSCLRRGPAIFRSPISCWPGATQEQQNARHTRRAHSRTLKNAQLRRWPRLQSISVAWETSSRPVDQAARPRRLRSKTYGIATRGWPPPSYHFTSKTKLRYRLRHCFGLGSTVGHPASRLSALNRRLSCRAGSAEMLWAFRVSNRLTVEVADVLAVEAVPR